MGIIIKLNDITKEVMLGKSKITILKNINLEVKEGEFLSIMGPSGSGKSTLLNIIGCLDRPTSGIYFLEGKSVDKLSDESLAKIRNKKIGFVFQSFNLIPFYTALRNVEVPMIYANKQNRKQIAFELLKKVGLEDRINSKPSILSGGEKQRVAIARALSNDPNIILADEPTGALDSKTGKEILDIFKELNRQGKTIILITHDKEVAKAAERIIYIRDGVIQNEIS